MLELLLRIGFSLTVVLGLMWLLARAARRPLSRRGAGNAVTVLSRAPLTRGASIAVVQVDERALILGVTENQVSLLGEADAAALRPVVVERPDPVRAESGGALQGSALSPRTWARALEFLRERTVRR
ncbi:MAG TPA: flagellar biosynthetic protein FliO [Rugosimonospora sp.]|nr:flagellar biosynthetic protein FliO [Rugosimonospora sp.]